MSNVQQQTRQPKPYQIHQVDHTWSFWDKLSKGGRQRVRGLWAKAGFNHKTATVLRYELDMLQLRAGCWISPRFRRSVKKLQPRKDLQVHLGCGSVLLKGWVNVDCYPPPPAEGAEIVTCDMRRGLPFADGSVAVLFSEHLLEHLPMEVVRDTMLPEIRRILKPGGFVRISIPNGEFFIEQYLRDREGKTDPLYEENRDRKSAMTMLNDVAHGFGHYFLYDFQTMKGYMEAAGLTNVRKGEFGDSRCPILKDLDRPDPWRKAISLYVEAQAPEV